MKQPPLVWLLAAALVVSLSVNIFGHSAVKERKYPLLAKRLFVSNPNDLIINFTTLRKDLKTYIANQHERIGVYFEYLPTGVSVGVNDRDEFYRASLVKLPGVMRAYKLIEEGKLKEKTYSK